MSLWQPLMVGVGTGHVLQHRDTRVLGLTNLVGPLGCVVRSYRPSQHPPKPRWKTDLATPRLQLWRQWAPVVWAKVHRCGPRLKRYVGVRTTDR
jgi:hypothetical protein